MMVRISHYIKARVAISQNTTIQTTTIQKSADVRRERRVGLVKSLMWGTLLYGAESWTLKRGDEKVLQSFEMCVCGEEF